MNCGAGAGASTVAVSFVSAGAVTIIPGAVSTLAVLEQPINPTTSNAASRSVEIFFEKRFTGFPPHDIQFIIINTIIV